MGFWQRVKGIRDFLFNEEAPEHRFIHRNEVAALPNRKLVAKQRVLMGIVEYTCYADNPEKVEAMQKRATKLSEELYYLYNDPYFKGMGIRIIVDDITKDVRPYSEPNPVMWNSEIRYYDFIPVHATIYTNAYYASDHVHEYGHLLDLSHPSSNMTYSREDWYQKFHTEYVSRLPEDKRTSKYHSNPMESFTRVFQVWYEEINPQLNYLKLRPHEMDASHHLAAQMYAEQREFFNAKFRSIFPRVYAASLQGREEARLRSELTNLSTQGEVAVAEQRTGGTHPTPNHPTL